MKRFHVALLIMLAGVSCLWAAKKAPAPAPELTAQGKELEAKYAAELKTLKSQIQRELSTFDASKRAAYQKAVDGEKAAKAKLDAANKMQGSAKRAEGLVNHAKGKWIGGADHAIKNAKKKLAAAKTDAQRKAAQKELEKAEKNRAAGVKALKERQAALAKAKAEEAAAPRKIAAARKELEQAKARTQRVLKDSGLGKALEDGDLDAKLVKFVILHEATPRGLAAFAQQGPKQQALVEKMFSSTSFMRAMLVADGAKGGKYGQAITIYDAIQKASKKSRSGVLQRLALAIALEHAVPISQRNPVAAKNAPSHVDPVKRYLHYEKAYLAGELDPAFKTLTIWDLRFVVHGNEPDETLAWGREMMRNFHPDHIYNPNYGWRYVNIVATDVRYGSGDVKYDRPELQFFQNILMNGGVCGRRAFFGRFVLRAFGIPTTARPSRGHAALVHWTPKGWVVNLGPRWGGGWTKTVYNKDRDFLASTQARAVGKDYLKVKRAMWIGDAMGEKRAYGESGGKPGLWGGLSLQLQRSIIEESKAETLAALGEELGESNQMTEAQKVIATPVKPEDKEVSYNNGVITIPSVAYANCNKREVHAMKSFGGGMQVFMPRFSPVGVTIMRGGAWRGGAGTPHGRTKSSGYGRYNNWGFRAAMSASNGRNPKEVTLDLGNDVKMEFVYIKPGKFIMGGTNTKDSKWVGVDAPKHEVEITKGFYLGKYEVTQAQFQHIMGHNPSKGGKGPTHPADNISEADAVKFCELAAAKTERAVRLPFEAEWEYACRAGTTTDFPWGNNASKAVEYAWFKDNDGGSSHPVGQKKPNQWGIYDMFGNVCERVADRYDANYYKVSPKKDPTGPGLKKKNFAEYKIKAPRAGKYALTATVCTANYSQHFLVSTNGGSDVTMMLPFTCGEWKDAKPVTVDLKAGENTLQIWRLQPPQYGIAVKSYTLKPIR